MRRVDAEKKTAGGIIIPDTAKEKPQQSELLAVGPGQRDETGKLVALFGKWSGTEVKMDGEDLLIMKEDDIMGVVEGAATGSTSRKVGAVAAVLALGVLIAAPFAF